MNIRDTYKKHSDTIIKVALYIASLAFLTVFASLLNIPPVNDEVATLASPMYLLGNDWSETLCSIGGYYFKYGAGMVYLPLMLIFKDPYVLYKSMLILNVAINAFIPVICYTIFKKHLNVTRAKALIISICAIVYPSTVLYTMYTRADSLLLFLPWPIILVMLELLKATYDMAGGNKKTLRRRRVLLSCLLAFLSVAAYAVHTRGIVIFLAVVVAAVICFIIFRSRFIAVIPFAAVSTVMFFVDKALSGFFYDRLYSYYGTSYSSVESYNFGALSKIFTGEGFKAFIKETIGTLFNVCVSSYGLVIIAVILGVILICRYFKHKSVASPGVILFTAFTLILFVGTFCMSIIYFFPYVLDYYTGVNIIRSDWLVYGRYIACSSPLAVILGIYLLIRDDEKRHVIVKCVSFLMYAALVFVFVKWCAPYMEGVSSVSRNFIQICTFVELPGIGLSTGIISNITEAMMMAGILGGTVFAILIALSMFKKGRISCIFITLCFIVASVILTIVNYDKVRISRDNRLVEWTQNSTDVLLDLDGFTDYPVYVDDTAKDIKHYQYVLSEYTCCSDLTDSASEDNLFIISKKKVFPKDMYNDDYYIIDGFDYDKPPHDILFVKGKELAGKLKESGLVLDRYTGKLK